MSVGPLRTQAPYFTQMKRNGFTREEAEGYVGRAVRSLVAISTLPKGATGRVVDLVEIQPDQFQLVIEWDSGRASQSLRDWFSRDDYDRDLVEV